jgi:hypothetical protein
LIVGLGGVPYVQTSAVAGLTARDDLAFVTQPAYSPECTPVEECWRPLQTAFGNRFFDPLDEFPIANDTALDQLSLSYVSNYL